MAHLENGQVEVDRDSNLSIYGPSGTRKRKATSSYLLVGGSSNTYKVTISTAGAHFCNDHAGEPCKGNTFGKARKYGSVHKRDRNDAQQWCKHVSAALASPELIAEAQDLTASAFGAPIVKAIEKIVETAKELHPKTEPTADARDRLAELDAERDALAAKIASEKVAALIAEVGLDAFKFAAALHAS